MRKMKLIIIIFLVILSLAMISTDYYLATQDKPPEFSFQTDIYKDGGTKVYLGLGYKVIDYNTIDGRKDVVFIPFYIDKWELK